MSLQEVVDATRGRLVSRGGKGFFTGISTDSRSVRPGDLFVALKGERFDAHDFVGAAFRAGAGGALIHRPVRHGGVRTVISVTDTLSALGDIAGYWRERYPIPLAAVTGSNGKTTTKEILAGILGFAGYRVLKTEGNLNNLIGVPLMLLRLSDADNCAVLELGASRFGEIGRLAEISMPDVGLITTIGRAHLEFFKTLRGVARGKGELLDHLTGDDAAVLNGDEPLMREIGRTCRARKVFFGFTRGAHVRCRDVVDKGLEGSRISVDIAGRKMTVEVPLPGLHNVLNSLAGIAGAYTLVGRIPKDCVQEGLRSVVLPPGRFRVITKRGIVIIDDTYNANPASMAAALRALCRLKGAGRGMAILGDMLELGREEAPSHVELGRTAASQGVGTLIAMGKNARRVLSGALKGGMDKAAVRCVRSHGEAAAVARGLLRRGDWVLVKGSRAMAMEKVVDLL